MPTLPLAAAMCAPVHPNRQIGLSPPTLTFIVVRSAARVVPRAHYGNTAASRRSRASIRRIERCEAPRFRCLPHGMSQKKLQREWKGCTSLHDGMPGFRGSLRHQVTSAQIMFEEQAILHVNNTFALCSAATLTKLVHSPPPI